MYRSCAATPAEGLRAVFDEIRTVRIERVKDLLMKPGQEVFAIPDLCGYSSLADLCRDFKKRTGQALRGWRNAAQ